MQNFLKKYAIAILLILGFATRFAGIWYPPNVVWDEQHFCNFTKSYLEKKYFFDIHPPLGKLILLSSLKTRGASPEGLDCTIGNHYPDNYPYVATRVLPAIAGSLLPIIIYLLARRLALSPAVSFFAGAFVLLDNAILAESKFGLIDIFVPFFGFLALLFFLIHRKKEANSRAWFGWLCATGVSAALSVGTKWTGGGILLVIGVLTLIECVEQKTYKVFLARLVLIGVIVGVIYTALFAVHFQLLPFSGGGDAFMSERFRVSLSGTTESKEAKLKPFNFIQKFAETNKRMFEVNASQKLTHQDSSRYYEWPIGRKRIYFWVDKEDGAKKLFLAANPVVWLFGSITTLGSILYFIFRRHALQRLAASNHAWHTHIHSLGFLYLIYALNWLPFAAVTRAMFLYHYFSSMIASVLIGCFILFHLVPALETVDAKTTDSTSSEKPDSMTTHPSKQQWYLFWGLLILAFAAFLFFLPITYGFRSFFK